VASALVVISACKITAPGPGATVAPGGAERSSKTAALPEVTELLARALSIGAHGAIDSKLLGERREYLVYTPPSYVDPESKFPVLYLLDAEAHFHHVTGIVAFLADIGRIPPMIVVGVVNTERTRDLTPSRETHLATSGGAESFVRFLETELIPAIDARYRTHPYRILVGHSFGGLFATHVLVEHPQLFDAYVAASPSLDWGQGLIVRRARERWKGGQRLDGFLYFSLGDEPKEITQSNEELAAFLGTRAPSGLVWAFEHMRGEGHLGTAHRTVYEGLNELFKDLRLPGDLRLPAAVEAHYRALSERFRFPLRPSETSLTNLGYRLLSEDQHHQAVGIFRLLVDTYPDSPNAQDSLGEALEKIGEPEGALESYELAVERATAQGHQLLELFVRNRDRLRDELSKSPR
jgi:hypothetical protein